MANSIIIGITLLGILVNVGTGISILKPEYGLLYEDHGTLYQGLERYYAVIGIKLPKFELHDAYYANQPSIVDCKSYYREMETSRAVCNDLLPLHQHYRDNELRAINEIRLLLDRDIPAMFGKSRQTGQFRVKRFVGALLNLAVTGVTAYLEHKKEQKMKNAMSILLANQETIQERVLTLSDDLVSIAKVTNQEIASVYTQLKDERKEITILERRLENHWMFLNRTAVALTDNANAIKLTSRLLGEILTHYERHLSLYQEMKSELDHFMDAMDALSSGHLSHALIAPHKLYDILRKIGEDLYHEYPEFKPVILDFHKYYDLPNINYRYNAHEGMLAIQIPILLQHQSQQAMTLYNLRTVPVPYNLGEPITELETDTQFTQLKLKADMLAVSRKGTYSSFKHSDLGSCLILDRNYYCEKQMFVYATSQKSCETSILFNKTKVDIKELCDFEYLYDFTPTPTVLDSGDTLLLAGLERPWRIDCMGKHPTTSTYTGHAYAVLEKKAICNCTVLAGQFQLHGHPYKCETSNLHQGFAHTLNMALILHFPQKSVKYIDTSHLLSAEPIRLVLDDPIILESPEIDVIETKTEVKAMALQEAVQMVTEHRDKYKSKSDKAMSYTKLKSWFEEDNYGFGITFIGAILAAIAIVAVIIAIIMVVVSKTKVMGINKKLSSVMVGLSGMPVKAAYTDLAIGEQISSNTKVIIALQIVGWVILIYIMYQIIKRLIKWVHYKITLNIVSDKKMSNDLTDLYLEVTQLGRKETELVYVGSYHGYPTNFELEGQFCSKDFNFTKHIIYDLITIPWHTVRLTYRGHIITLPACIEVPLTKKLKIRKLFKYTLGQFRMIAKLGNLISVVPNIPRKYRHSPITIRKGVNLPKLSIPPIPKYNLNLNKIPEKELDSEEEENVWTLRKSPDIPPKFGGLQLTDQLDLNANHPKYESMDSIEDIVSFKTHKPTIHRLDSTSSSCQHAIGEISCALCRSRSMEHQL